MPFKELSQAELNSEHFKALRESPQYFTECYADYMREVNPIPEIESPEPVVQTIYLDKPKHLSYEQWNEINQLKSRILHLEDRLNKQPKKEKNDYF